MKRPLALFCGVFVCISLICSVAGMQKAGAICLPFVIVCLILSLTFKNKHKELLLTAVSAIAAFAVFTAGIVAVYKPAVSLSSNADVHDFYVCITDDNTAKVLKVDGKRVFPFNVKLYSDDIPDVGVYANLKGTANEISRGRGVYTNGLYDHSKGTYLYIKKPVINPTDKTSVIVGSAYRFRCAVSDRLYSKLDSNTAGKMCGILLGDKSGIALSDRNMYSAVGISHIFAVSGLHVSIILLMLGFILRLFRLNRKVTSAVMIVFTLLIMYAVGFTASVTRAGIMAIVLALSYGYERDADTMTSLMLSGFVICLSSPFAAADCSFLLSFTAVLGLLLLPKYVTAFFNRCFAVIGVNNRISRWISNALSVSFSVMIFTMPIIAICFGSATLLSPIGNLAVVWVMLPLLVTALLLILIPVNIFAAIVTAIIGYIDFAVSLILKTVNFNYAATTAVMILLITAVITLFLICIRFGSTAYNKAIFSFLVILAVTAAAGSVFTSYDGLIYEMLDVGVGNCSVYINDGKAVVVNCGSRTVGSMSCVYSLSDCLDRYGIYDIDALIITDSSYASISAFDELCDSYDIGTIYVTDAGLTDRDNVVILDNGSVTFSLGDVGFTVTAQGRTAAVRAVYGDSVITLLGDMNYDTEQAFYGIGSTDILIASGNGKASANSYEMLNALKPKAILVSCGESDYDILSDSTVLRLAAYCDENVYTTMQYGTIEIRTNGQEYRIRTERG